MQKTKSKKQSQPPYPITQLVEQGYALHLQLTSITEELKTIKNRLKAEALLHPAERVPLSDESSEGLQWIAQGENAQCHIIFPAPRLISSLEATHRDLMTIQSLTGDHFTDLFRSVTDFQVADRAHFRAEVAKRFSVLTATHLIELCSVPSESRAVWKPLP